MTSLTTVTLNTLCGRADEQKENCHYIMQHKFQVCTIIVISDVQTSK